MTSLDYLVELTLPPADRLLAPEQGRAFTEAFVIPTLEACERHAAAGRIAAGGPTLGVMGFSFIARVSTPQELEELVAGLPLWARARTRIVPLGRFADRLNAIRGRLAAPRAGVATAEQYQAPQLISERP